jgi:hypothetical protein
MLLMACVAAAQESKAPESTSSPLGEADGAKGSAGEGQQSAPSASAPNQAAEPTTPPAPPTVNALLPPEFHNRVLSWDNEKHQATQGRDRKALSRDEFFTTIERPDLVEKSTSLSRRRLVLGTASVVTGLAGIVSGLMVLGNNVDLNSLECVQNNAAFNSCSDTHRTNSVIGTSLIVAGVIGAGLFATFAYWSSPAVVDDDEAQRLISRYNGDLLKKLRMNAMLLPGGGAVGISANF